MSGTVQLPRKRVPNLLSTFRKDNSKIAMNNSVKEPDNVNDLPISTDEEEQPSSSEHPFIDSSDDNVHFGNIQKTIFRRKPDSNSVVKAGAASGRSSTANKKNSVELAEGTSTGRLTHRTGPKKRIKDEIEDDNEDNHDPVTSKKAKPGSKLLVGDVGAHMSSEKLLFTKPVAQRGYGKKSQSLPHAKLKIKHYPDFTSPKRELKFKNKNAAINSSPVANLELLQPCKTEEGDSSLSDGLSSEGKSDPPRALEGRNKKQKPVRRPGKKSKKQVTEFSPEPVSQKPQFKMPDAYNDYAPSAALVDLDVHADDDTLEHERRLDPGMALCPMCDEQVDGKLLQEFSNGERMKLVRQVKFCRMHKRASAQKTWEEKGYPVVDWAGLQTRIEGHHDFLESIIMGKGSHFGDLLKENIRTGQARTLLTTKDYLTPGYYGLRGMSVMTEAVTDAFSNLLRKRAPLDTRISGRGYTGFVQSVLVPELAVKLIQEDLSVGEGRARKVMTESRVVGEILNDERRHSQSQAPLQMYEQSTAVEDDNSEDTASVELQIEQAADCVSDLSSPPSYSQRPASAMAQETDDSDSSGSLKSLGGRETKRFQASVKKQKATAFPSLASPSSRNNKGPAPS